jgi:hypothetical protein
MPKWLPLTQAAEELGISSRTLQRRRESDFKYGLHFKDLRGKNGTKPMRVYCVEAIEKIYDTPPEKRK